MDGDLIIATLGGLLGDVYIALRRLFIVEEALPYPEGVATVKCWLLVKRVAMVRLPFSMRWPSVASTA